MPQEDKFKREIDRIGLVLAKLLAIALHKNYPYNDVTIDIAKQFKSELDIDLGEFILMDQEEGLRFLVHDKKFSVEHLRNLANLLYELARQTNDEGTKQKLLTKALNIYEYIHANAIDTLYIDVVYRIKELKGI